MDRFPNDPQISNFIKIRPVGAEFFHADGQTDRYDEANSRFLQFSEIAKTIKYVPRSELTLP
jgi:hypothetical protein